MPKWYVLSPSVDCISGIPFGLISAYEIFLRENHCDSRGLGAGMGQGGGCHMRIRYSLVIIN
jgi:hypothetical protein